LAARTGGAVVTPDQRGPIVWPARARDGFALTPYLATAGGALIGLGLLLWRRMV
jgi:hypothetical protein